MARARNRAIGGVSSAFREGFLEEGLLSGWLGTGKKVEMNKVGESRDRQRYGRESSVPSCPLPVRGKGGGKWMNRRSKEGQGGWRYNTNTDTTARAGIDGQGWQGAGPQLWLGNVSCLLAREH